MNELDLLILTINRHLHSLDSHTSCILSVCLIRDHPSALCKCTRSHVCDLCSKCIVNSTIARTLPSSTSQSVLHPPISLSDKIHTALLKFSASCSTGCRCTDCADGAICRYPTRSLVCASHPWLHFTLRRLVREYLQSLIF